MDIVGRRGIDLMVAKGNGKSQVVAALEELAKEASSTNLEQRLLEIIEPIRAALEAGATWKAVAKRITETHVPVSVTSLRRFGKKHLNRVREAKKPKAGLQRDENRSANPKFRAAYNQDDSDL